jgi:hypothetical protein
MDLSRAITAIEKHMANKNKLLRAAWDTVHYKLIEEMDKNEASKTSACDRCGSKAGIVLCYECAHR